MHIGLQPGYWWRWSRHGMSPEGLRACGAPWIALYVQEPYDLAIASTARVLTLKNPPSEDPTHLSFHAAGGEPQASRRCGPITAAQKTIAQLERLSSPAMPEAAPSGRADKRETTMSPAPRRESRDPRASGVSLVSAAEAAARSRARPQEQVRGSRTAAAEGAARPRTARCLRARRRHKPLSK